jgi:NAD(P)-dependent dehydrogenase (short-subunit alcohol dehydrogenase family)
LTFGIVDPRLGEEEDLWGAWRMNGRVVIITGSTQGVGLAIAQAVAHAGAEGLVVTGRDADKGAAAAAEVERSGAPALFVAADLEHATAPDLIFNAALKRFGRVDALVNSAALTDRGSLAEADMKFWDRLFAVNARAPFFLMQRLVNHLRERGAPGSIVNILSIHAYGGSPELAVYASTKSALAGLTKNAANAHRFDRIRVNGVILGWVDTPAERHMQAVTLGKGEGWLADAAATMPFKRMLTPDDVARLSLFLLSDASEPMSGALIDYTQNVFGGLD